VTGTNGKTTVSFLLRGMLKELTGPCGLLGTVRYEDGRRTQAAPLTTPAGPQLYELLARMVANGCRAASLEISSHALDQGRVADLALDVAVLTNLGRDHLDYHPSREDYLAAKAGILKLVQASRRRGKKPGAVAVNAADLAFSGLDLSGLRVVRYAAQPLPDGCEPVDLQVVSSRLGLDGTHVTFQHAGGQVQLGSRLVGRFNVENLTAALAAGLGLGFPLERCAQALGNVGQVPGRLERFVLPGGGLAVVDYAHTPDALAAVLATCRELTTGSLLVVFGCGGDRDRGKRPLMGAVAARGADHVWITSDNPRSEDPAAICQQIVEGFNLIKQPHARSCRVLVDRAAAISSALAAARPLDIVIVAGKGHEDYQLIGERRLELDDRRIITDWIAQRSAHV
jgi:UDP-N-acetylmuramoyl-L-alanyl-D-glutamate--2,6-diaminopimelate ligase